MKRIYLLVTCFAGLLLLSACSTTTSRIKKNQELFDGLSEIEQTQIKAGNVDIGFSKEMVLIALGKPVRERTRKTKDGVVDVWAWVDFQYHHERQMTRGNFRYKDNNGTSRVVTDNIWVDVRNKTEYDKLRIEFGKDGKVLAIESID